MFIENKEKQTGKRYLLISTSEAPPFLNDYRYLSSINEVSDVALCLWEHSLLLA